MIKSRLTQIEHSNSSNFEDRQIALKVLYKVLKDLLVMLHPLMPHLTEELWHGLTGYTDDKLLSLEPWPAKDLINLDIELNLT